MGIRIRLFRGKEATIPKLMVGELAFTTDTNKLLLGTDAGNQSFATVVLNNHVLDAMAHPATSITMQAVSGLLATNVQGGFSEIMGIINNHLNDTDNPHDVTVEQIGAETPEGTTEKINDAIATFVESFGIGGDAAPLIGADLNVAGATGLYFCSGCTNTPSGKDGYLINVKRATVGYDIQLFLNVDGTGYFFRYMVANTWGDWNQVATMEDVIKSGQDVSASDINNLGDNVGFFYGSGMTNAPDSGSWFIYQNSVADGANKEQTATSFADGKTYKRVKTAGVWGGWRFSPTLNEPTEAEQGKFLRGDMTWQTITPGSMLTLAHMASPLNTALTDYDVLAKASFHAEASRFKPTIKVLVSEKGNGNVKVDVTDGTNTVTAEMLNKNNANYATQTVDIDCSTLLDNAVWTVVLSGRAVSGEYVVSRLLVQGVPADALADLPLITQTPNMSVNMSSLTKLDIRKFPVNMAYDTACKLRVVAKVSLDPGTTAALVKFIATSTDGTQTSILDTTLSYDASGIQTALLDFPNVIAPTVSVEVQGATNGSFRLEHWEVRLVV
ncbi:pyocin knob domain-containing protein [Anaeroselena agilis]|uniref:Pyocin knob domain-containing protein n=1 Tax=Anaeroselena agilis TaxID=3063788 RepID=A0ABU3NVV7_9FIRM|nr:pyocin knob domain-containing protein [Selenomonadales bacterium 4137-cl]